MKFLNFSNGLKIISLVSLLLGIAVCTTCFLLFAFEDNLNHKIAFHLQQQTNKKQEFENNPSHQHEKTEEESTVDRNLMHIQLLKDDWADFQPMFYSVLGLVVVCGLLITLPSAGILCASDKGTKYYAKPWMVSQGLIGLLMFTSSIVMYLMDKKMEGADVRAPKFEKDVTEQKLEISRWFYFMATVALALHMFLITTACYWYRIKFSEETTLSTTPATSSTSSAKHQQSQQKNNSSSNNNSNSNSSQKPAAGHSAGLNKIQISRQSNGPPERVSQVIAKQQQQKASESETSATDTSGGTSGTKERRPIPKPRQKLPRPVTRFELKCMSVKLKSNKDSGGKCREKDALLVEDQFL